MLVCYRKGKSLSVIDVDTDDHRIAISEVAEYAMGKHPKSVKSPILAIIEGGKKRRKA